MEGNGRRWQGKEKDGNDGDMYRILNKENGRDGSVPRVVATLVVDPGSVPSLCVRAKSCS